MEKEDRAVLRQRLYGHSPKKEDYSTENYQDHFLEQYKLYVEMADRISNRRGVANAFFATLNTTFLSAIVGLLDNDVRNAFLLPIVGILICGFWAGLLRSYRNLNTAKFAIIGLMEESLPSSPYWHAEWYALGQGNDWKKHIPFGAIEILIPTVFALLYAVVLVLSWV